MLPDKSRGFMTFARTLAPNRPVAERVRNFEEFAQSLSPEALKKQAYRCMNCGVPFCHSGCPLGNMIPDFNDYAKDDAWRAALEILHSTNNFPEFTGRVCPAPCESACVLGIIDPPVTIEMLEREIADQGWSKGYIEPQPPARRTGKRVAVVGSGPSGLAAAQQLNRAGHEVVVYERSDRPGGLLTYGIPNFKLDKRIVARRVKQLEDEGVVFRCGSEVGKNVPVAELEGYDAVLIAIGSTRPRTFESMNVPGWNLNGIHPAMDFLTQQTRRLLGKPVEGPEILATGKKVVVIGGGDTGSDCVGTSIRQGCVSILNLELFPKPPEQRAENNPWPQWDFVLRTSSSHLEAPGGDCREWCVNTKAFEDDGKGNVCAIQTVKVDWSEPDASGRRTMTEIPGSERRIECDLVLLAMGFTQPEADCFVKGLGVELEKNRFGQAIKADAGYQTTHPGVFACGDARRGQSLVVWAIHEGREAARAVDLYLMGYSDLPAANGFVYDSVQPGYSA
ncbi:MAG TPA: glutamate synthase subunit beta [Candidatus Hydrogenedentes bacterium]|nr:glutamate synthase subunit beta [Candidatus Hydrogenedentota bacterium]